MPRLSRGQAWRGLLQALFIAVLLFFLVRAVVAGREGVAAFSWRFRPVPLLASVLIQVGAGVFWATVWRRMAVRAGSSIGWSDGVRVYLLSNLAKYIPGSVWGYLGRAYLGRSHGLTMSRVGVSTVWEVGITVVASLLLTAMTIPAYPVALPQTLFYLVLAAATVSLILLLPPVFRGWIRRLSRWIGPQDTSAFDWRDFGVYLASAWVTHVLVGTAFFLFASSITDLEPGLWWGMVGIWSFSATAGLVVVLAPYGLGVKEGLLALLLQALMPPGAAALVSLASRLWTILTELVAAGIAALVLRPRRNTPYG